MRRKNKKEKILKHLNQATEPVDVEKIRKASGIGNWNTALNYCLTLLVDGKIKGQKTSKSWVFWTRQQTQLQPWQEARGCLEALQDTEDKVALSLSRVQQNLNIAYPKDTSEAQALIQQLKDIPKGTKVALLQTDIPQKPLVIKVINKPEGTDSNKEAHAAHAWQEERLIDDTERTLIYMRFMVFVSPRLPHRLQISYFFNNYCVGE